MRVRLPLSLKILIWFFFNVLLLAGVSVFLFNAQFRFDLNWLLQNVASENVDRMRIPLTDALERSPLEEWGDVIERFSSANHVQLSLLDDEGKHLIGPVQELPAEILSRYARPPQFGEGQPSQSKGPQGGPTGGASTGQPAQGTTAAGQPPRTPEQRRLYFRTRGMRDFVRTTNPTHYWLIMGVRLENPQTGGPMRAILVADDTSVSMGGLIVDFTPWLKLGLGAVAFSVLFWFPLLRGITRTIGKMTHATKQIAEGKFGVRVPSKRRDELGELAESVNQMAARLDGLLKGQKRFLGDIAHELCSPLARLQMSLGIIEQHSDEKQMVYVKTAGEKAEQIATLVNSLLAFSKASFGAESVKLQQVNVKAVAEKAVQGEMHEGAKIDVDVPEGLTAHADPDLLTRAIANLVRNALRYGGQGGKDGKVTVSATKAGDGVSIVVGDNGPGVPEEELPKIFDAFYRLDTSRTRETGGVGLGLTIVKTCVESCRGAVMARNRMPHGLEVVITLPVDGEKI